MNNTRREEEEEENAFSFYFAFSFYQKRHQTLCEVESVKLGPVYHIPWKYEIVNYKCSSNSPIRMQYFKVCQIE